MNNRDESTLAGLVKSTMPGVLRRTLGKPQLSGDWLEAWFADPTFLEAEALYERVRSIVECQAIIGPIHAARALAFPRRAGQAMSGRLLARESGAAGGQRVINLVYWSADLRLAAATWRQDFARFGLQPEAARLDGLFEAAGLSPDQRGPARRRFENDLRSLIKVGWRELGARTACPPVRFIRPLRAQRFGGQYLLFGQPRDRIEIPSGMLMAGLLARSHPVIDFADLDLSAQEQRDFFCCPYAPDTYAGTSYGFLMLHELAHASERYQTHVPDFAGADAPYMNIMAERNASSIGQSTLVAERIIEPLTPENVILIATAGFYAVFFDASRLAQMSEEPRPKFLEEALTLARPVRFLDEALADARAAKVVTGVREVVPTPWLWEGNTDYTAGYRDGAALLYDIFGADFDPLALRDVADPLEILLAAIKGRMGAQRAAEVRAELSTPGWLGLAEGLMGLGLSPVFARWRERWFCPSGASRDDA